MDNPVIPAPGPCRNELCTAQNCTNPSHGRFDAPAPPVEVVGANDAEDRARHLLPNAELPSLEQLKRECTALDLPAPGDESADQPLPSTDETVVCFWIRPPLTEDRWKKLHAAAVAIGAYRGHVNPPALATHAALVEGLRTYGRHTRDCDARPSLAGVCTCGFDALLAQLETRA